MSGGVRFHAWTGAALALGTHDGTTVTQGALRIDLPSGRREYDDPHRDDPARPWEEASWTSPEVTPGFAFTELVTSWNAVTPVGTWVEISLRARTDRGTTAWYVLGRWAETDVDIAPTSVPGQSDAHASVDVDRLVLAAGLAGIAYQVRVTLLRLPGSVATPTVSLAGCLASDVPVSESTGGSPAPEATGTRTGTVLDVPAYSQQLHRGRYPQWAGGGESWCSPTSTSMVLDYWGLGPTAADYAWVDTAEPDRFVAYAARHTFDHAYGAPGNWSFNTAYAARFGTVAFVTRLRSLAEAELFVAAGVPLVVAVSFTREQLDGAGYATAGHLLVVVGFDERGDVVVNDPASHEEPSSARVRATFDRDQLAAAWMRSSGGITYVIRPAGVPLPQPPTEANW